ncbi:AAA family ATPase [Iodobacter sp.]|uniref:AAA family ATPase n=1 Tax=Iodobacter sp. TaxID=1915058 RepID=UPI0025F8FAE0|nr:AAA family ATPase [Iodobacter sp.]
MRQRAFLMLRYGLIVGKFAPLHLGHEALIHFARQHCDQLLLLSYTSQALSHSTLRRQWLKAAFPWAQVCVLDAARLASWPELQLPDDFASDNVQREFVRQVLLRLGFRPDCVFSSESYGPGFAAYLSTATHPVQHIAFDPDRQQFPISATQIRNNPQQAKQWLSARVYQDFMLPDVQCIALLGGESSGKSTLAKRLADEFATLYAAEYGRELWQAKDGQLEYADLLVIAQTQIQREQQLQTQARQYLFCDTTPLSTLFYSQAMFAKVDPQLLQLAQRTYSFTFLLAPDFAFVQDGTRQGDAFRQRQHLWHEQQLIKRGVAYTLLTGTIAQRVQQVIAVLRM